MISCDALYRSPAKYAWKHVWMTGQMVARRSLQEHNNLFHSKCENTLTHAHSHTRIGDMKAEQSHILFIVIECRFWANTAQNPACCPCYPKRCALDGIHIFDFVISFCSIGDTGSFRETIMWRFRCDPIRQSIQRHTNHFICAKLARQIGGGGCRYNNR